MSSPALMLPEGYALVSFDTIGSTNDEAKKRVRSGAPSGTVIWARQQNAGRGRRGRAWVSPPGNLYCSVIVRPSRPAEDKAQVSFVAALALCDAIREFAPAESVRLKWPNDVLISGAKTSGILLETEGDAWIVVGMGVNLNSHPPDTPYPATSVAESGGQLVAPEQMLARLLHHFDHWYNEWHRYGFAPLRTAWLERAQGVGRDIVVRLASGEIHGVFEDLDESGALVLEEPNGTRQRILSGDVFFAPVPKAG